MEKIVKLHIEKLTEGVYLATSDDIQGLFAQGRTIAETLEIARDVAKKFIEVQKEEMKLKWEISECTKNTEGNLWQGLSKEEKDELILALEESEDPENLIDHEDMKERHKKWL